MRDGAVLGEQMREVYVVVTNCERTPCAAYAGTGEDVVNGEQGEDQSREFGWEE